MKSAQKLRDYENSDSIFQTILFGFPCVRVPIPTVNNISNVWKFSNGSVDGCKPKCILVQEHNIKFSSVP